MTFLIGYIFAVTPSGKNKDALEKKRKLSCTNYITQYPKTLPALVNYYCMFGSFGCQDASSKCDKMYKNPKNQTKCNIQLCVKYNFLSLKIKNLKEYYLLIIFLWYQKTLTTIQVALFLIQLKHKLSKINSVVFYLGTIMNGDFQIG